MGLSAAVPAYVTLQWGSVAALRGSCVQVFQVQHSEHAPSLPGALFSLLLPGALLHAKFMPGPSIDPCRVLKP